MSLCQQKLDTAKRSCFSITRLEALKYLPTSTVLQPTISQLPNPATFPITEVPVCPSLFPTLFILVSVLLISCVKSHTSSSCPLASSCCFNKCPSRGLTRASFYTQVLAHGCQLPFLPPITESSYCLLLPLCCPV